MFVRVALAAMFFAVVGCDQPTASGDASGQSAQLEAPAPENEPARVFAPANDAAASATGQLNVSIALRLPDARGGQGDAQEVLTLTGANGVVVEAQVSGVVSPATQVQGQTLRALLGIPVQEPRVAVYRVTSETRAGGRGVCGGDSAAFVVVWEPAGPSQPVMKILGLLGAAPGAAAARACPMLEYRRA